MSLACVTNLSEYNSNSGNSSIEEGFLTTDQKDPYHMSKMYQCPRFEDCNVIVCPLYEHWEKTKLIAGRESNSCYYLRKLAQNAPETDSEGGISVFMELVDTKALEILLGRMHQSKSTYILRPS